MKTRMETVTLELVRPGKAHGQLLSPLTPYLALCGGESPVTLNIELEHWNLLNRLERLRYITPGRAGSGMVAMPDSSREAELKELGAEVAAIFSDIPTLGRELGKAAGQNSELVHLRLVISGSELSLIPYELVIAPDGYPGTGLHLLLQPKTRIILTREVRRGRPIPVNWDRKPKILFISAAPGGSTVPMLEHLHALRRVLEPWISWVNDKIERQKEVKKHLTVLPNASLQDIKQACAEGEYTHVHILAHGGAYEEAGQTYYGLILCHHEQRNKPHVIDGQTLAGAIQIKYASRHSYSEPAVVSLATCDSGNIGSVVAPGASIAHDLHEYGVPWVIASQFPLTKRGSIALTERLYKDLLWGRDPRALIWDLRRELHVSRSNDHDWASLTTYTSIPNNFDREVDMFRSHQFQRARDVLLARAQESGEADKYLEEARRIIQVWKVQLPENGDSRSQKILSECLGVEGATEKRIAQFHFDSIRVEDTEEVKAEKSAKVDKALRSALRAYHESLQVKPDEHWQATQYLCLSAYLEDDKDLALWEATRSRAQVDMNTKTGQDLAWAHGTLAELELLRVYYASRSKGVAEIVETVEKHCKAIVEIVGWDDFAIKSTRDQFERYEKWWIKSNWKRIAHAAVKSLTR